jgi:gas vesicle protein GvpL/GvpF
VSLIMYAVAERQASGLAGTGIDGRPLRAVADGALSVVVGDYDATGRTPSQDELWAYERVIEQLMASRAVLPARYGSLFASDVDAQEMLRERTSELTAALVRVRGAVELAVRACWTADYPPDATAATENPGTGYMQGQLERRRHARQAASELGPLRALARESRVRLLPEPGVPVAAAYLVDRDRVGEFVQVVAELGNANPDLDLVCTGPWPPYSFVDGGPQ